jgi:hypothetical protein
VGSREQTHCKNGHPFDEANTHYRPNGRRWCRACSRERARASYVPRPKPKRARSVRAAKPRTRSAKPKPARAKVKVEPEVPTDADFLAQLQVETEVSLRRDPSRWKWSTASGGRAAREGETTCEGCGQPFTRDRADRRYHSEGCRQRAEWQRRNQRQARTR